jgi:hypothetical protein
MPIGSLKGELTAKEQAEQRGMMLVSLAGKVNAWLVRRKPPVPLWLLIPDPMAGRYDFGPGTFDQKRAAMIKDFVARHPELRKKLNQRKPPQGDR